MSCSQSIVQDVNEHPRMGVVNKAINRRAHRQVQQSRKMYWGIMLSQRSVFQQWRIQPLCRSKGRQEC